MLLLNIYHILQARHAGDGNVTWGVDGETGNIVDMKDFGIWEPYSVKVQTYKTAIEVPMLHTQYFGSLCISSVV